MSVIDEGTSIGFDSSYSASAVLEDKREAMRNQEFPMFSEKLPAHLNGNSRLQSLHDVCVSAWVYTEYDRPQIEGPFHSRDELLACKLWESMRACIWFEARIGDSWFYENMAWNGFQWESTSARIVCCRPFRPHWLGRISA